MTFQSGKSGNPSGRPKGLIDKRSTLRGMLEPHAKDIVEKLVSLAKGGDLTALKLCVERLIPRVRQDESILFELPEGQIDNGENMLRIVNNIIESVADGLLTLEEAEKLTEFFKNQRWVMELARKKIKDDSWKKERGLNID